MIRKASTWPFSAVAVLGLLAGCGGGGSSSEAGASTGSVFSAEGVYGGTLRGNSTLALDMLVLETGEVWALYGQQFNGQLLVSGFFQGNSSASATGIRATDLRDYATAPPAVLDLSAAAGSSTGTLAGTLGTAQGSASISLGPLAGSAYRYEARALPDAVQGSWTLTTLQGEVQSVAVAADGSLSARGQNGCNFSGRVLPRASGKNVFDVSLDFGPAPCALANQSATGIALVYPLASGGNQLIVAVHDAARSLGTAAFGVR